MVAYSFVDRACGGEAIIRFSEQDNHNREWEGVSLASASQDGPGPTNMKCCIVLSVGPIDCQ